MITIDRKGALNPKYLVIIELIVHGWTRLIACIDFSVFSRVCLGGRRNFRPSFTAELHFCMALCPSPAQGKMMNAIISRLG